MRIKAKLLKDYINAVSKLDNEPCLNITKEGLDTKCVDPAHVSMMVVNVPVSNELVITEEPFTFCIDAKQFSKYLGSFAPTATLDFTTDGERCRITDGKIKFTARLLSSKNPPKIPRLTLNTKATIPTKDVKAVMSGKYDTLRFQVNDGKITISAGDENDTIEVVNDCKSENANAQYPADYISSALMGESLNIEFGNDLPIMLIPELEGMEVSILVAPRIEND